MSSELLPNLDGPRLPRFDEIGYWTELKLDIIKDYATAYSTILAKQPKLEHWYVDAFAGPGWHKRKDTKEFVQGSPLNALNVRPLFARFIFIDLDGDKAGFLKQQIGEENNVEIETGDCNEVLLSSVFPRLQFAQFKRALCLLDPYGLTLSWDVVRSAGKMGSIEIFLNLPIMHMNRNVLRRNTDSVDPREEAKLTLFWGNEKWKAELYDNMNLFGFDEKKEQGNQRVLAAYLRKLKEEAGFKYVPDPLPMRNNQGGIVYYLIYASPNATGGRIVKHIFNKYRQRGEQE